MCIASFKGGYICCIHPLFCRNSYSNCAYTATSHFFQQTFKYGYPEGCDVLKDVGEGQTLHLAPRVNVTQALLHHEKGRFIHCGSENGRDVQYPGPWTVMASQ